MILLLFTRNRRLPCNSYFLTLATIELEMLLSNHITRAYQFLPCQISIYGRPSTHLDAGYVRPYFVHRLLLKRWLPHLPDRNCYGQKVATRLLILSPLEL